MKVAEVSCPVALYTAASTSERLAFHTLNRKTGNRIRRQFVDGETGKPVEKDDQVKGYEVGDGEYIMLEPEEVAAAVPDSDKTLAIKAFLACSDIDDIYFDRPYYLAPTDRHAEEAFAVIREGMRVKKVAALASTVLFRKVNTLLIRAHGTGMIATTLNFDYEVRSAKDAFADVPEIKVKGEMLELAEHIINTKKGKFDVSTFDDRYENALADLVKAKLEGKPIEIRKERPPAKVVDLMEALRQSAEAIKKKTSARPVAKPKATRGRAKAKAKAKAKVKTTAPRRKAS